MGRNGTYTFVCPECAETIVVDESMRNALIDHGCVICGSPVSADVFTPA